ncbi:hypothetical protein Golax_022446, partial [Gossypium laxum]|nr:hypothetical protein [Gossypium laxum]
MSDAYEKVKGGRLTFKGGSLATRKSIDKSKKKHKKKKIAEDYSQPTLDASTVSRSCSPSRLRSSVTTLKTPKPHQWNKPSMIVLRRKPIVTVN